VTIRTQTLLIVTVLLVAAVLATAGVLGWRARQAVLAETEAQGLVIARLLSRGAAFGAGVMNDVEAAIGEQMVVEAKMAAYFIVDLDVHDPAGMREYLERVPGTLAKYGGRYIVRGGKFEIVEGNWQPSRVVMPSSSSRTRSRFSRSWELRLSSRAWSTFFSACSSRKRCALPGPMLR